MNGNLNKRNVFIGIILFIIILLLGVLFASKLIISNDKTNINKSTSKYSQYNQKFYDYSKKGIVIIEYDGGYMIKDEYINNIYQLIEYTSNNQMTKIEYEGDYYETADEKLELLNELDLNEIYAFKTYGINQDGLLVSYEISKCTFEIANLSKIEMRDILYSFQRLYFITPAESRTKIEDLKLNISFNKNLKKDVRESVILSITDIVEKNKYKKYNINIVNKNNESNVFIVAE